MTGDNGLVPIKVFASEAEEYYDENFEDNTIYPTGHEPQQSLPATWYNTLMRNLTAQAQATYSLCTSMFEELKYAIEQSGQILDNTAYTQLAFAIKKLSELQVATDSVLGGVKSSALDWKVLVNSDATMSVNTTTASTTVEGLTTLVDDCTTSDSTKAATAKAVKTAYDRASAAIDAANSAVKTVEVSLSGSTLTISVNGVSDEIDLSPLSPDSVTRATYAQYLVNSTSPSGTNYVTADTSKNISGHTLTLS